MQYTSRVFAHFTVATLLATATAQKLRRAVSHEIVTIGHIFLTNESYSKCDPGSQGCKSVCRWLGFSDQNEHFEPSGSGGPPMRVCPGVENRLKECDYKPEEKRAASAHPHPFDCAVTILQESVLEGQLESAVNTLIACSEEIPEEEKNRCRDASALLDVEFNHWRADAAARAEANVQREQLEAAIAEGQAALDRKARVREAMASLSGALQTAEVVPGFYVRETIHFARRLLRDLNPVALVLEELERAKEDGRQALDSKDSYSCEQAILRLGIVMNKAEDYEIGQPLDEAQALEEDLELLSSAAEEMNAAIVQANSSHATVSCMGKSLTRLQSSIDAARELGITRRVQEAEHVFGDLFDLKMAYIEMKAAILQGEAAIAAGVGETSAIAELELALNSSAAVSLHKALPTAVDILHELVRLQGEHSVEEIPDIPNR